MPIQQSKGAMRGTVAAPGLYLGTDTTTGLYQIGNGNVGLSIGGTKLLDFSSATVALTGALTTTGDGSVGGRLGVGAAASATYPLNLVQNDNNFVRYLTSNSRVWRQGGSGANAVGGTFALVDDSASSIRWKVDQYGTHDFGAGVYQGAHDDSSFTVYVNPDIGNLAGMNFAKVFIWTSPFANGANGDLIEIATGEDHDGTYRVIYTLVNGVKAASATSFSVTNAGYTATWSATAGAGYITVYVGASPMVAYVKSWVHVFSGYSL